MAETKQKQTAMTAPAAPPTHPDAGGCQYCSLSLRARDHYDDERREAVAREAGWKARAELAEQELREARDAAARLAGRPGETAGDIFLAAMVAMFEHVGVCPDSECHTCDVAFNHGRLAWKVYAASRHKALSPDEIDAARAVLHADLKAAQDRVLTLELELLAAKRAAAGPAPETPHCTYDSLDSDDPGMGPDWQCALPAGHQGPHTPLVGGTVQEFNAQQNELAAPVPAVAPPAALDDETLERMCIAWLKTTANFVDDGDTLTDFFAERRKAAATAARAVLTQAAQKDGVQ